MSLNLTHYRFFSDGSLAGTGTADAPRERIKA